MKAKDILLSKCKDYSFSEGICRYRSTGGCACFIGAFIPNDLYQPDMEGCTVGGLMRNFPNVIPFLPFGGETFRLQRLQVTHDESRRKGVPFSSALAKAIELLGEEEI